MTPTARTLKFLRDRGIPAEVVERWLSYTPKKNSGGGPRPPPGVRKDLFGLFDIIAICDAYIVGIQCCAMSGRAAHEQAMQANPRLPQWLAAGGRADLWAWRSLKLKRGGVAVRWEPEVTEVKPGAARKVLV